MSAPTFTVIIPHHNCPELLTRCISSVPNNDDIEIILVDDNSDNIVEFDNCIKKIHHKNLRVIKSTQSRRAGGARNLGLEAAIGKWILFLDADDYFLDNAFTHFSPYSLSDSDIIYFKHKSVFSDTLQPCIRSQYRNDAISKFITDPNSRNLNTVKFGDIVPWGKMLRRSLIIDNGIRFDEIPCCEDVMFITKCANFAKKVSINEDSVYCVTYRTTSLMVAHSKEKDWTSLIVALERNRYLKGINKTNQMNRLLSFVLLALRRYGVRESFRYIREIRNNGHSLLEGLFT